MLNLVELSLNSRILSQLRFTQESDHTRVQVLESDKPRIAKPEEIVRQLVVASLITKYGYQPHLIELEHVIQIGINRPRADICILNEQGQIIEIIEVKGFQPKEATAQLRSYLIASGARFGAVVTTEQSISYSVDEDKSLVELSEFPKPEMPIDRQNRPSISDPQVSHDPFPIQELVRVSRKKVCLKANDAEITLELTDAIRLSIVQKAFLRAGINLDFRKLSSKSWNDKITSALLASEDAPLPASKADSITSEFLLSLLQISVNNTTLEAFVRSANERDHDPKGIMVRTWAEQGIRLIEEDIVFANSFASGLFQSTPYRDTWREKIKNIPGYNNCQGKVLRFGTSGSSRCASIPREILLSLIARQSDAHRNWGLLRK